MLTRHVLVDVEQCWKRRPAMAVTDVSMSPSPTRTPPGLAPLAAPPASVRSAPTTTTFDDRLYKSLD